MKQAPRAPKVTPVQQAPLEPPARRETKATRVTLEQQVKQVPQGPRVRPAQQALREPPEQQALKGNQARRALRVSRAPLALCSYSTEVLSPGPQEPQWP